MPSRNEPTRVMSDDRSLAAGPKRINWQIDDVASRDGHSLRARFSATASITTSSADAAMIRETFRCEPSTLMADAVRDYFLGTVQPATFSYLNRQDVATFDDAVQIDVACEAIAEALRVAGFSAGVRFMPPFALTIESPSRQRLALETAARARAAEALAHATSTMQQFQRLRSEQPNASIDQVLTQVGSASETLLPTLLRGYAEQRNASRIVVTSGEQLVVFSRENGTWLSQPIEFPSPIGALRCVLPLPVFGERAGERAFAIPPVLKNLKNEEPSPQPSPRVQGEGGSALLVGGQRGIIVLTDDASSNIVYRMPADCLSQLGINSIARGSKYLFATHSDFGLIVWPLDKPELPRLFKCSQAKFATMIDARRCLLAAGDQLMIADGESLQPVARPTAAGVISIVGDVTRTQVIFADGTVTSLDSGQSQLEIDSRLGGSITLATTIDWLGERRLIIANDRGEIECVGDSSRTRFVSSHAGWRKLAAASDLIAALSLDRTRLVLWRPWEPQQPMAELHVASLTQHRVADVILLPSDDLSG